MRVFGVIVLVACRSPVDAVDAAHRSVETSSPDLWATIDPDYADTLGGRARLEKDIAALHERFGKIDLDLGEPKEIAGTSELVAQVVGSIDADFVGRPTWKVRGTITIDVARRADGFRIRSGLLTDFRDIEELMALRRAALEANDSSLVRSLLHPSYRDGDLDADAVEERLAEHLGDRKVRLDVSNYRLELRGTSAHVDEHYVISVDDRPSRPLIGRFTLLRSAGRWRIGSGLYPAAEEPR